MKNYTVNHIKMLENFHLTVEKYLTLIFEKQILNYRLRSDIYEKIWKKRLCVEKKQQEQIVLKKRVKILKDIFHMYIFNQ